MGQGTQARPFTVTVLANAATATYATNIGFDVCPVVTAVESSGSTVVPEVEASSSAAGLITVTLEAPQASNVTVNGVYFK